MKILPFNDGLCSIYTIEKRTISETLGVFDFHEETVGITAYTNFQNLGIEVEKVISIPYNNVAKTGRVVKLSNENNYYLISLIQVKDTLPKSLKLTLTKTSINWNEVASI